MVTLVNVCHVCVQIVTALFAYHLFCAWSCNQFLILPAVFVGLRMCVYLCLTYLMRIAFYVCPPLAGVPYLTGLCLY
jgi:hypothetical protein